MNGLRTRRSPLMPTQDSCSGATWRLGWGGMFSKKGLRAVV
jgi:hypothetical protein